jgi:hypothetical protein
MSMYKPVNYQKGWHGWIATIVTRPHRLFSMDEIVFCYMSNGGAERYPVTGYSMKRRAPILDYYMQVRRFDFKVSTSGLDNRTVLKGLDLPGDALVGGALDPGIRRRLVEAYEHAIPHRQVGSSSLATTSEG